ncbi:MAG: DUF4810 domain-containing protein [Noviherbaspirillum sp.]
MRSLIILSASLAIAGCAAPPLYQWGAYEPMLYAGYKDPANMEVMRVSLEDHIMVLETSRQKVAPGLYAELGTLYLQGGAHDKAVALYARERDAWPESKGLMEAMIKNLRRGNAIPSDVAK